MIHIKEYKHLNFINWVKSRTRNNTYFLDYGQIEVLVEEYMINSNKRWGVKFLIKLYQDYITSIIISGKEINDENTLTSFCNDVRNLTYVQIQTIDKQPRLKPLFQNFINYLKEENLFKNFNYDFIYLSKLSLRQEDDISYWFKKVGEQKIYILDEYFNIYMNNPINEEYKDEFFDWARECSLDYNQYTEFNIENYYRSNRKLNLINSIIDNYENSYVGNVVRLKEMHKFENSIKLIQTNDDHILIDVLNYIEDKGLLINKSIPKHMLYDLIDEYCKEYDIGNNQKLKKELKRIVDNKNELRYFIDNVFKRNNLSTKFNLERYYECKNHGLLLFEQNGKISEFLKKYLKDIHELTGKNLDIYFTDEDLKKDTCAYESIKKLSYIKVKDKDIPCLLVWDRYKKETSTISFENLNNDEIYLAIKELALELKTDCLSNGVIKANKKIEEMKEDKKNKIIYYNIIGNENIGSIGDKVTSIILGGK